MNLSIGQKYWVCVFNQDGKPRVKTMPEQKIKEILIGDVLA